jgi:hypothetical protein
VTSLQCREDAAEEIAIAELDALIDQDGLRRGDREADVRQHQRSQKGKRGVDGRIMVSYTKQ